MTRCLICRKPIPDYVPEYMPFEDEGDEYPGYKCLNEEPINPCVCSDECKAALLAMDNVCLSYDERRRKAGIKIYHEEGRLGFSKYEPCGRYGCKGIIKQSNKEPFECFCPVCGWKEMNE
ncbi:MAG: hypothetical protein WC143_08320 [Eubacteriales bacterium]